MIPSTSAATVLAQAWDMHDGGWGWGLVMVFGMFVFWALVIGAIVWLIRDWRGGPGPAGGREPALEILDRRLASGEIDVDEYERRRTAISGGSTAA